MACSVERIPEQRILNSSSMTRAVVSHGDMMYRIQLRPAPHRLTRRNPAALAPNGLASDRRLSDAECDKRLAQIFGGPGAVVGSTRDPLTVGSNPNALLMLIDMDCLLTG